MSKEIVYLSDYEDEADLRRSSFGKTDKYSTGFTGLDMYLGHGFGTRHGYEIITVFGEPGVGKSTFALNMLSHEMAIGTKIGLMVLEDDMPDVYNRLRQIMKDTGGMAAIKRNRNIESIPSSMLENPWTFQDILKWIRDKNQDCGIGLFLVDHINFVFDNAEIADPRKEMAEQRKFMRDLNFMCRKLKLTVILVSHTSKGDQEGMAKVFGTTAIIQVSTKVIGVKIGEGATLSIQMYKSRFTMRQDSPWVMNRVGLKLDDLPSQPIIIKKKK